MFTVRYAEGQSAYIRVPRDVGAFGASPAVLRAAKEQRAAGLIPSGEIITITRVR